VVAVEDDEFDEVSCGVGDGASVEERGGEVFFSGE
jgi:hypothetical protein